MEYVNRILKDPILWRTPIGYIWVGVLLTWLITLATGSETPGTQEVLWWMLMGAIAVTAVWVVFLAVGLLLLFWFCSAIWPPEPHVTDTTPLSHASRQNT